MASIDKQARVAVVGAGAVGSYFGGMLARSGVPVTLIARAAHVEAIRANKLFIDAMSFQERVAVNASTEIIRSARCGRGSVLRENDRHGRSRSVARAVPRAERNRRKPAKRGGQRSANSRGVGNRRAGCGGVHRRGDARARPRETFRRRQLGRRRASRSQSSRPQSSRPRASDRKLADRELGDRELTDRNSTSKSSAPPPEGRAERIAALFTAAGVPCRVSPDIEADMWSKFVMNCAGNAVTGITQISYTSLAHSAITPDIFSLVIAETVAVARAAGVKLPEVDFVSEGLKFLQGVGSGATSSTAQDLARGKRTEIDSLNGYVARRGKELGIATPANLVLFALVKLLEEKAADQQPASSQKAST